MPDWHDVGDLHQTLAAADPEGIAPLLVGFAGDDPLVVITLRPFPQGEYHDPVIEAMALAIPFGADRVSLSMPARVWSLDDPIAPVTEDVDLRQRALVETRIDGHSHRPAKARMLLYPFAVVDDTLQWKEPVDPGPAQGWIPEALACLVDGRDDIGRDATAEQLVDQMRRLDARGHAVGLMPAGGHRLLELRPGGCSP